jgi:hypothetical protein
LSPGFFVGAAMLLDILDFFCLMALAAGLALTAIFGLYCGLAKWLIRGAR